MNGQDGGAPPRREPEGSGEADVTPAGPGPARFAVRWATWLDRRRHLVLGIALLLCAAGALLASRLPLRPDLSYLLPPHTRSVRDLRAVEKRVQVFGSLLVAVEAGSPDARARAATALIARLGQIDPELLARVEVDDGAKRRFAWDHRFLYAALDDLVAARDGLAERIRQAKLKANPAYISFEDDEPEAKGEGEDRLASLRARLEEAEQAALHPSPKVSKDGLLQLLTLRATFPSQDVGHSRALLAAVERAIAATRAEVPDARMGMTGDVMTATIEHSAILKGMTASTVVTILVVGLSLVLFYRSKLAVGALLFALLTGTLATFGVTRLTIGHLNVATAFLASIVIGNGINFSIMVLARHLEERRGGRKGVDAIARALSGTARGTLAAASAAGVAYASLIVTDFRGFRDFGLVGGIGMVLCWLAAFTVLPAALAVLERRGWVRVAAEPAVGKIIARVVPRRAALVAAGGLAVAAVSGVVTWRYLASSPFEYDMNQLRSVGPEARAARALQKRLDDSFGRWLSGGFFLATNSQDEARQVAAVLRATTVDNGPAPGIFGRIVAIDDALPPDQPRKLEVLGEIRRLLDDQTLSFLSDEERAEALELRPPDDLGPVTTADLPAELVQAYTEKGGEVGRIVVATQGPAINAWNGKDITRLTTTVRALPLPKDTKVAGNAFIFSDILDNISREGPIATLVALLGVILFAGVIVGKGRPVVATVAAGLTGTVAMVAIVALCGIKINFLDFVALPITMGIGVDYAVNVVARAQQEGPGGARRALETTGGAVAMCSWTTIVGYGSLLISDNGAIRSFGKAAVIGEFTCLFAGLIIAPALIDAALRRARAK